MQSNLTRGSLYGRGRRGPDPSWRRLRSLSLALLLVVLLMQQAGDPQVYRNFFIKLGVPLAETESASAIPADASVRAVEVRRSDTPAEVPLASRIAEQLDRQTVEFLTAALARVRQGELDPSDAETITRLRDSLQQLSQSLSDDADARTEIDAWIDALQSPVEQAELRRLSQWLQPALDELYLGRVRDASVWHADDSAALFRYLERAADEGTLADSTPTGVLPLLDQPSVYRGRTFQITGRAVRAERIVGRDNAFGIESYWMVWLNPEDGSNRPAVLYAPQVSHDVQQLPATDTTLDGPRVTAHGVYLKRLLYQSGAGAEAAPVLVGRLTSHEPPPIVQTAETGMPFWLIVTIACGVGVAFAGWVYWTSAREARRRRTLRETGRPRFDASASLKSMETRREGPA